MSVKLTTYRAKRLFDRAWIYNTSILHDRNGRYYLRNNELWEEVDPQTIGRSTDLECVKKKARVESRVFEGDVFRSELDTEEGTETVYSVVTFIDSRAAFYFIPTAHYPLISENGVPQDDPDFSWLFTDASLYEFSLDCTTLTKVGNIHDVPKLLDK